MRNISHMHSWRILDVPKWREIWPQLVADTQLIVEDIKVPLSTDYYNLRPGSMDGPLVDIDLGININGVGKCSQCHRGGTIKSILHFKIGHEPIGVRVKPIQVTARPKEVINQLNSRLLRPTQLIDRKCGSGETFVLKPKGTGWMCKTALKPYDEVITAILLRAWHSAGPAVEN